MKIFPAIAAVCIIFIAAGFSMADENNAKKRPVIEGEIGPGFVGAEPFFINTGYAERLWTLIPTGKIHLRFADGRFLAPEIMVEESGAFLFDRNGIREGKKPQSYGSYYLKLPLGIPVPFFTYKSTMAADAVYTTMNTRLKTKNRVVVNNALRGPGEYFSALSTSFMVRLYLNTPIVEEPSIFQHSYFGIYYSERTYPRTATPGGDNPGGPVLLVDTDSRSGGIFFDMKKDTIAKGLNVEVYAFAGYASIEVRDSAKIAGASFGNTEGLVSIGARAGLSYRYIFDKGLGLKFSAGVEYYTDLEFFNAANAKKYSVNLGGELKYFANLSFVFIY